MRGKLLFITGGLVGYVLGARAGRKRYDQIVASAESLWNADPVQRRVTEARDFALERVGDVPATLINAGKKLVGALADKTAKATDAAGSGPRYGTSWPTKRPAATTPPAASAASATSAATPAQGTPDPGAPTSEASSL
ncbi:YtxH domain-containing protein [Cryobacterium breve]|uniref:YtxH domain-containing protein n=1 Tax=Cryobacterium breve TaxID=1259258 RepID=A0ABY7NDY0_9MICO|nr:MULTISPECIES: YtxH domain-containing protein [Cryobacterium]MEA9999788.1 YtxH domain-containing protein [Cryobacterium sp. RTS3]WBM78996.1 YtxH domain-containing protein [Cryobacterium breve]